MNDSTEMLSVAHTLLGPIHKIVLHRDQKKVRKFLMKNCVQFSRIWVNMRWMRASPVIRLVFAVIKTDICQNTAKD